MTSGNALRAFLERRVPLSAVLLTSAAQHALLVIGAALVLRPTVERNPVPHTVDRRLLHPIGIIIGCPWMSAVKATQNTLLAIARAASRRSKTKVCVEPLALPVACSNLSNMAVLHSANRSCLRLHSA